LQLKNLKNRQKSEVDVNSFSESKRQAKNKLQSSRKNVTSRDQAENSNMSRRNHFSKLTITTERSHSVHNVRDDPYRGVTKEMLINELEIIKQRQKLATLKH
jgi:hypothetical protein